MVAEFFYIHGQNNSLENNTRRDQRIQKLTKLKIIIYGYHSITDIDI